MIDILTRWNRWGSAKLDAGIERDITSQLIPFLHSPEVIVLIGPRRSGKTTVLFQIMNLLEKLGIVPEAMLHINLEEPALTPQLSLDLLDQLYNTYREEVYPQGKAYLFLDEIQNVPQWERWVRARNETENIKIFITGSSSQLMSRELGTLLTGRHISFKVLPLSFAEFLRFNAIDLPKKILTATPTIKNALNKYLRWGGFPEVVLASHDIRKELLLKQYFDDVLFKDIIVRHAIRDAITLRNMAVFLLTQTASLISFQRLTKLFGISLHVAQAYSHYLQEALMIDFIPFYSQKVAERQRNPQKVHAIDLGLRNIVSMTHSEDRGRLIESVVYNNLQRKPHNGIFYWKHQSEIDLLVRQGNKIETLLQVVMEGLDIPSVRARELAAFRDAETIFTQAKKMLIIDKSPKQKVKLQNNIEVIPLWLFLLRK